MKTSGDGDLAQSGGGGSAASKDRFGPLILADGRALFRLWAPGLDAVSLEVEGAEPLPMRDEPEGWNAVEAPCRPGQRYRFHLPDGATMPDPASRLQSGDVSGWSVLVDHAAFPWRTEGWTGRPWPETVLHELHAGLCGGFEGIAADLPRLKALGVNTIELMPIAEFPGRRNWGYDGVIPFAPDEAYGTPDDLKRLVDAAHAQGVAVMLDVVYNHFGPDGAYLHVSAPPAFRDDIKTPWGPALDFRQPALRDYFIESALSWVRDYRIDGLRLDAVHAIASDDFLPELARRLQDAVGRDRHLHLVLENENNDVSLLEGRYDAQWNDDFHHCVHVLLTGERDAYYEGYADDPAGMLARSLAEGFVFQGEIMPGHDKPRGQPSGGLPPSAFVNFVQNHDQIGNRAMGERLIALADPRGVEVATALMLLGPAVPMLFMGEEYGSRDPFLFFTDHHDELADAVREGRRAEFAAFPAFANEKTREKIPDPNAASTYEASRPTKPEDTEHWTTLYRDLIGIRTKRLAPHLAEAKSLGASVLSPKSVAARWRMGEAGILAILANFGADAVSVDPPGGEALFALQGAAPGATELPPYGFLACLLPSDRA